MIKAKPSIPNVKFILLEDNQFIVNKNWNCVVVVSKKNNKPTQQFNIKRDQNNEKFLIKCCCVFSTKKSTKQPTNGKKLIINKIKKKVFKICLWIRFFYCYQKFSVYSKSIFLKGKAYK